MSDQKMDNMWKKIMDLVKQRISPSSLETWVNECSPLAIADQKLYVEVTENRYRRLGGTPLPASAG